MKKMYSVKEVCDQTGLTGKILFDYEREKIILPAYHKTNGYSREYDKNGVSTEVIYKGYKMYDEHALLKFHQVAIFRKLNMKRAEIKKIMTASNYDSILVLDEQIQLLVNKKKEIEDLIAVAESLKMIGISNQISQQVAKMNFRDVARKLEKWECSESALYLETVFEQVIANEEACAIFDDCLDELRNSANDECNKKSVRYCIDIFKERFGFSGWVAIMSLGVLCQGDGEVAYEFKEAFSTDIIQKLSRLLFECIEQDLGGVCRSLEKKIKNINSIAGNDYSEEIETQMIVQFKEVLEEKLRIRSKDDIELAFQYFDVEEHALDESSLFFALYLIRKSFYN